MNSYYYVALAVVLSVIAAVATVQTMVPANLQATIAELKADAGHEARVMVHVKSGPESPHAVMMGLQKALKAKEAGVDTFIFFDVLATKVVLNETDIKFADFPSSKTFIKDLLAKGVEVYVCPHCLMVNGGKMSEVIPGVKELTMEAMLGFADKNLITLDY